MSIIKIFQPNKSSKLLRCNIQRSNVFIQDFETCTGSSSSETTSYWWLPGWRLTEASWLLRKRSYWRRNVWCSQISFPFPPVVLDMIPHCRYPLLQRLHHTPETNDSIVPFLRLMASLWCKGSNHNDCPSIALFTPKIYIKNFLTAHCTCYNY